MSNNLPSSFSVIQKDTIPTAGIATESLSPVYSTLNLTTTTSYIQQPISIKQNNIPVSYYFQIIITLAILITILVLTLRFTKFIQAKKYTSEIKITDRLPIDNNVSLLMIETQDHRYLLSLANKSVQMLDKFSKSTLDNGNKI